MLCKLQFNAVRCIYPGSTLGRINCHHLAEKVMARNLKNYANRDNRDKLERSHRNYHYNCDKTILKLYNSLTLTNVI